MHSVGHSVSQSLLQSGSLLCGPVSAAGKKVEEIIIGQSKRARELGCRPASQRQAIWAAKKAVSKEQSDEAFFLSILAGLLYSDCPHSAVLCALGLSASTIAQCTCL
eukprot:scaffold539846_cov16-Prasinocladus_malaysianus.AAC.1